MEKLEDQRKDDSLVFLPINYLVIFFYFTLDFSPQCQKEKQNLLALLILILMTVSISIPTMTVALMCQRLSIMVFFQA